ncbi:putative acetyltransferase [Pseudarthrobacter chlorophenolicus A6]|uniref:Lysine N-acyltransferase MbtK n=1 Tax=Pseudarthrobacter chlorophenolicus (strain ATCC 700700 / DSM 12829 / CIP 107037 / JCM 12360 / KCTC 9906 / NCIMB 13794 / A6) TaxID=452863 RepID=B8HGG8_PSECP|nr:GNAT family N-acetyltransferase [Pseudarthrobacter chlorophenolicus]ACL41234.1 putative acetyltransferase [Pseudarthrobacter chlorophenolicus A6]SDQ67876.1 Protein N-acetyltransferase, RimJ/RimL family [Pseudarthrobacter chlorophenolicus]
MGTDASGHTREAVYGEELEGLGWLRLFRLAPEDDADLIHSWVSEERAKFWGMNGWSRDEVRDVYRFLDSLDTHHGYLMVVDGEPAGIFQTYEPQQDPVGEAYPALPTDAGIHLFLAPTGTPVPNYTPKVMEGLVRFVLSDPAKDRVVAEPDARNGKAIRRMESFGFERGPVVQLAEKEAQLMFLGRAAFEARTSGRGEVRPGI